MWQDEVLFEGECSIMKYKLISAELFVCGLLVSKNAFLLLMNFCTPRTKKFGLNMAQWITVVSKHTFLLTITNNSSFNNIAVF
jgi:hypothetical protein